MPSSIRTFVSRFLLSVTPRAGMAGTQGSSGPIATTSPADGGAVAPGSEPAQQTPGPSESQPSAARSDASMGAESGVGAAAGVPLFSLHQLVPLQADPAASARGALDSGVPAGPTVERRAIADSSAEQVLAADDLAMLASARPAQSATEPGGGSDALTPVGAPRTQPEEGRVDTESPFGAAAQSATEVTATPARPSESAGTAGSSVIGSAALESPPLRTGRLNLVASEAPAGPPPPPLDSAPASASASGTLESSTEPALRSAGLPNSKAGSCPHSPSSILDGSAPLAARLGRRQRRGFVVADHSVMADGDVVAEQLSGASPAHQAAAAPRQFDGIELSATHTELRPRQRPPEGKMIDPLSRGRPRARRTERRWRVPSGAAAPRGHTLGGGDSRPPDTAFTDRLDGQGDLFNVAAYGLATLFTLCRTLYVNAGDGDDDASVDDVRQVVDIVRNARFVDGSVGWGYLTMWLRGDFSVEPLKNLEFDAPPSVLVLLLAFFRSNEAARPMQKDFEERIRAQVRCQGAGRARAFNTSRWHFPSQGCVMAERLEQARRDLSGGAGLTYRSIAYSAAAELVRHWRHDAGKECPISKERFSDGGAVVVGGCGHGMLANAFYDMAGQKQRDPPARGEVAKCAICKAYVLWELVEPASGAAPPRAASPAVSTDLAPVEEPHVADIRAPIDWQAACRSFSSEVPPSATFAPQTRMDAVAPTPLRVASSAENDDGGPDPRDQERMQKAAKAAAAADRRHKGQTTATNVTASGPQLDDAPSDSDADSVAEVVRGTGSARAARSGSGVRWSRSQNDALAESACSAASGLMGGGISGDSTFVTPEAAAGARKRRRQQQGDDPIGTSIDSDMFGEGAAGVALLGLARGGGRSGAAFKPAMAQADADSLQRTRLGALQAGPSCFRFEELAAGTVDGLKRLFRVRFASALAGRKAAAEALEAGRCSVDTVTIFPRDAVAVQLLRTIIEVSGSALRVRAALGEHGLVKVRGYC